MPRCRRLWCLNRLFECWRGGIVRTSPLCAQLTLALQINRYSWALSQAQIRNHLSILRRKSLIHTLYAGGLWWMDALVILHAPFSHNPQTPTCNTPLNMSSLFVPPPPSSLPCRLSHSHCAGGSVSSWATWDMKWHPPPFCQQSPCFLDWGYIDLIAIMWLYCHNLLLAVGKSPPLPPPEQGHGQLKNIILHMCPCSLTLQQRQHLPRICPFSKLLISGCSSWSW